MNISESFMESYKNLCRICLKQSDHLLKLFTLLFPSENTEVINFIRKITDLKFPESENLPDTICITCKNNAFSTFEFIQLCTASESKLRNIETRRILRKIEEEALQEEIINTLEQSPESPCDSKEIPEYEFSNKFDNTAKYQCNVCGVIFGNKVKFKKHQTSHVDSNIFKCETCLQTFPKQTHLNVHMRSHATDDKKKFCCDTCGQKFMYEYLLKQHQFKHSDIKPFPCPKCDKGCITAESLKRHLKTHDANYVKKTHTCKICNKSFLYPSFLAEHMKNHTGERPHLCSICGKGFRHNGALHFHQRIHSGQKPYKCEVCGRNFISQTMLKVHMRKHTNERPYVCYICGKAFRVSTDLKSHNRTHTKEKLVLCTICGKKMCTTGQLTIHLRSHTGEKPYSCSVCGKSFATRTILKKHTRIHTGERPYRCDICDKTFTQSSTMKNHYKIHKPKDLEKLHEGNQVDMSA